MKPAIQAIEFGTVFPGKIGSLADRIRPVVEVVAKQPGDLLRNAIDANVKQGVDRLQASKAIISPTIESGRLKVVGGVYELETGLASLLASDPREPFLGGLLISAAAVDRCLTVRFIECD